MEFSVKEKGHYTLYFFKLNLNIMSQSALTSIYTASLHLVNKIATVIGDDFNNKYFV
jgi:hypothetical protein